MSSDIAHLELLAEVDSLTGELQSWIAHAPTWPPAQSCGSLVRRLLERVDTMRVRLEAPLVVATLGGTGTGKSSLVNAIAGDDITAAGRQRPTTRQPILICRSDLSPQQLGIAPQDVHWTPHENNALRDLVLIDCPDPDTTEGAADEGTNLARLRHLLPHCDVLLVTSTQQKYRSARVIEELAAAAPGARLVFVQTHADTDDDIRHDWRKQLAKEYAVGEMFFIDSVAALADTRAGLAPRGEFAGLIDLLTRELAGAASTRIRRANFLDLVEQTLGLCGQRIDAAMPAVEKLESSLVEQRSKLASRLALAMRDELLASRRPWEQRLLGEVVSRFGFSPFAAVLRVYQGLGGLLSGAALWRARTPAQMALWGVFEGGRAIQRKRQERSADTAGERALAWSWDEGELRAAAIVLDGYAAEAGLPRDELRPAAFARQATAAGGEFITQAAGQLQVVIARLANRHTGWFTRLCYELALAAMLFVLLYRLGRNFFYDSWLAHELGHVSAPAPVLGADFFIPALFWLAAWCCLLVWLFTRRLQRGLFDELNRLAETWSQSVPTSLFGGLDEQCHQIRRFRDQRIHLESRVARMRSQLSQPEPRLGQKIA